MWQQGSDGCLKFQTSFDRTLVDGSTEHVDWRHSNGVCSYGYRMYH